MRMLESLPTLLAFEDSENADRVALRLRIGKRQAHRELTYAELRRDVALRAGALLHAGCASGQRVGLLMPHTEELFTSFLACLFVGLVPCILAWPTTKMDASKYRRNVTTVVARLGADFLLTDPESASQLGSALGATRVVDPSALEAPGPATPQPRSSGVLFIQFSGGTTGVQKSVPVSAEILCAQLDAFSERLQLRPDDAVISWLPLYHDMGLIACLLMPFLFRLPLSAFAPMEWVMDPRPFLEQVAPDRATLAWLPNFAFAFMASRVRQLPEGLDLGSLRAVINCSEPVRSESMDAFISRFAAAGFRADAAQASYAMAETVFAITQTTPESPPVRLSVSRTSLANGQLSPATENARSLVSSGTPLRGVDLKIVDGGGVAVVAGRIGEIWVRAPFQMDGYLDAPDEARASSFTDGWYRTGDLGALWGAQLFVTGRRKDLVIVGGINVFPDDVEHTVSAVPGVHAGRAVALGFEDRLLGTDRLVVVAEATSEAEFARSDEIERTIRAAVLSEVGVAPSVVFLVPPQWIVKSTAGKVSRSETKARVLSSWAVLTKGSGTFVPDA